jgi:hypothetical protein
MSSEKQIAANRANGKKSRGPVTEEGKAICSQNAIPVSTDVSARPGLSQPYPSEGPTPRSALGQHGLLSNTIILPGESEERFHDLLADLVREHDPANITEMNLVENLAVSQWRRRRLLGLETGVIAEEMRSQDSSPGIVEKAAVLARLPRLPAHNRQFPLSRSDEPLRRPLIA